MSLTIRSFSYTGLQALLFKKYVDKYKKNKEKIVLKTLKNYINLINYPVIVIF